MVSKPVGTTAFKTHSPGILRQSRNIRVLKTIQERKLSVSVSSSVNGPAVTVCPINAEPGSVSLHIPVVMMGGRERNSPWKMQIKNLLLSNMTQAHLFFFFKFKVLCTWRH